VNGPEALDAVIARMRALAAGGPAFAEAAANALREEILANAEAGRGPDGAAWEPTEKGEKPLKNVASALEAKAVGDTVIARVSGHYANHHKGKTRGALARPILPSKRLSGAAVKAISTALGDTYGEIARGDQ
jgi:hypothetical protein